MGGGQDEGDAAAAARAFCLPHVMEDFFFVFPLKNCVVIMMPLPQERGPCQLGGLVPLGYWRVYEWQCAACEVLYHLLLVLPLFFSVNCDLK